MFDLPHRCSTFVTRVRQGALSTDQAFITFCNGCCLKGISGYKLNFSLAIVNKALTASMITQV